MPDVNSEQNYAFYRQVIHTDHMKVWDLEATTLEQFMVKVCSLGATVTFEMKSLSLVAHSPFGTFEFFWKGEVDSLGITRI